ncbi:MAG: AarF/UbiB family protein [Solirubrobacteraceae bacterium]
MTATQDAVRRMEAALEIGLRLARTTPSGRILLASVARRIDLEWIPRPWGDEIVAELRSVLDDAGETIKPKAVERGLREAWGSPPTQELDDFDAVPVAVTPTSQVHRGVLDGAPVAVKILRPGLALAMRQDLALLDRLHSPLAAAFPGLDPHAVVQEFGDRVLEELDLEIEAAAQRRFHRALRGHPLLLVPAPVTRLAHERVLVSEWIDGDPLWRAPDLDRAAAQLVLFTLGGAAAGIVHADPDPDDVRITADGRLAMLDFGAWREVDSARVTLAAGGLDAFRAGDAKRFGTAATALGWLPARHTGAALDLLHEALGDLAGPGAVRLDSAALIAARDRLLERTDAAVGLVLAGALPAQDLWPMRSVAQLVAAIARVGATGDWWELAADALREGWDARPGALGS